MRRARAPAACLRRGAASFRSPDNSVGPRPQQPPDPEPRGDRDPFVNPIVLIPARLSATRLPGKPLADIGGRPMVLHVFDRAREAGVGPVAVAAGDAAILDAVRAAGAEAVLADRDVPSGTDRVKLALDALDPDGRHDVVVNLQGDFPTLDPACLRAVLLPLADPAVDIGSLVAPIAGAAEGVDADVVPERPVAPRHRLAREVKGWRHRRVRREVARALHHLRRFRFRGVVDGRH